MCPNHRTDGAPVHTHTLYNVFVHLALVLFLLLADDDAMCLFSFSPFSFHLNRTARMSYIIKSHFLTGWQKPPQHTVHSIQRQQKVAIKLNNWLIGCMSAWAKHVLQSRWLHIIFHHLDKKKKYINVLHAINRQIIIQSTNNYNTLGRSVFFRVSVCRYYTLTHSCASPVTT